MDDLADGSVHISLPPSAEYLDLLRVVTCGALARLPISVDAVDDLTIAVDEAVAFLLVSVPGADRLHLTLAVRDDRVVARVDVEAGASDFPPEGYRSTLAWEVMSGLTDGVTIGGRGPTVELTKRILVDDGIS